MDIKNRYKLSSGCKEIQKNHFDGSRANFAQNRILKKKKKLPNLPKNTENPRFFEFQIAINLSELAQIGRIAYQKFLLALYSYQKTNLF